MFIYNIIFLVIFGQCYTYKLLVVFPLPRSSHITLGHGYVRHLLKAGHQVTYITPKPLNMSSTNLKQVNLASLYDDFPVENLINLKDVLIDKTVANDIRNIMKVMFEHANATIFHKSVQSLIQDTTEWFDAIIAEYMFSGLYSGFSSVFNCPFVWSVSMQPHNIHVALIDELQNPAYTYNHWSSVDPPFSFTERVTELYETIRYYYYAWLLSGDENKSYVNAFSSAVEKRGNVLPPYSEVKYNASLILGNSDISCGHAMRLPAAYKQIGGYHIVDIPPLSKNLQEIMDKARDGVIYFSMGSILRSKDMTDDMKNRLLDVFSSLNQTVIWKFEERLRNLPNNVNIVDWAPQQSILGHRNCLLFITHGGLLSTIEAVHFGVPIIGLPAFGDQYKNINRAVKKGFGKRVDLDMEMPKNLQVAIKDILQNSRYKEKVKEYSTIYHHRIAHPGEELVHWVEHVVRTRGAQYLRSSALLVPLYQKLYLDLVILVTITTLVVTKSVFQINILVIKYFYVKNKTE
ncbi:UDP-glucosyltransferase 2-like [Galleria mellonella]|uniref:UDP-glucuronosyltransferase n=1 Tax=Galleria mellonella TaxID=7137 RepID=A0ABM3MZ61_GALME|nr:UDP-glucosyltransferase 2-like [Galleria mellonella]